MGFVPIEVIDVFFMTMNPCAPVTVVILFAVVCRKDMAAFATPYNVDTELIEYDFVVLGVARYAMFIHSGVPPNATNINFSPWLAPKRYFGVCGRIRLNEASTFRQIYS
jgi:hypothetical protein